MDTYSYFYKTRENKTPSHTEARWIQQAKDWGCPLHIQLGGTVHPVPSERQWILKLQSLRELHCNGLACCSLAAAFVFFSTGSEHTLGKDVIITLTPRNHKCLKRETRKRWSHCWAVRKVVSWKPREWSFKEWLGNHQVPRDFHFTRMTKCPVLWEWICRKSTQNSPLLIWSASSIRSLDPGKKDECRQVF